MRLGGGGKARAFAIGVALLLAGCNLSPHPEDPGLAAGTGNKRGTSADAGAIFTGTGGAPGAAPSSGSGGSHSGDMTTLDAGESDAGAPRDGGNDSGASADAGATADAADAR